MAITWGPTLRFGNQNESRLGIDLYTMGNPASGSVTVRADFWLWTKYSIDDAQALNVSGSWSTSIAYRARAGQMLIGTRDWTVSTAYGSTSTRTVTGTVTGHWAGIQPSHSRVVTIPARPISSPAAVTSFTVSRGSDGRHTLRWAASPTAARPVAGFHIWRFSNAEPGGVGLHIAAGSVRSWTDSGTVGDRRYQWRIVPQNGAGYGPGVMSPEVYTTPAAPNRPTVTRSGTSAVVEVSQRSAVAQSAVWEYRIAGGDPVPLAGGTLNGITHENAPTGGDLEYRVAAVAAGLQSVWSAWSIPLQMLAAPNAPAPTTPAVVDAAVDGGVRLTWTHQPVDGSAQSAYDVQWREVGGAFAALGKTDSGESSHLLPATNGTVYEYQIRTWGAHADPGPWSPVRQVRAHARPTVTITSPEATQGTSALSVAWTYGGESSQAAWRVTVLHEGVQIGQWSGSGLTDRVNTPLVLANHSTYTVRVEVQNSLGQWSAAAEATVAVSYASPPAPTVAADWREDEGAVVLTVETPDPQDGEVPATTLTIQRSLTPDGPWTTIHADLPLDGTATDPIPPTGVTVYYRAIAGSGLDTTTPSEVVAVETTGWASWIWFNGGPGWGQSARLRANPTIQHSGGPVKELVRFDGRSFPVEFTARQEDHAGTVSASLLRESSTVEEILAVAGLPAPIAYRAPGDPVRFVSLGRPTFNRVPRVTTVAIPWTVVDYREDR